MTTSILKRLHDTAMACPNTATRSALQDHASAIRNVMRKLEFSMKDEHLRELNGLWVQAYVKMDAAQKPAEPTPPTTEVLKLEKMAA